MRVRSTWTVALIAALSFWLGACGSGSGPTPNPGGQVAAASTEVSFTVDGTVTYGTLQVPAHRSGQHLAAALLLAGSGPTDRDGNQGPTFTPDTLKQIANALSSQGIMSLRFDKYFAGKTGFGKFAGDPGDIDLDTFIRQATAAYTFLSRQPAVDAQKLLIVGHSEGGMYAILVAEAATPRPAGLALVEPQDERILDLVALQIDEGIDAAVTQGALSTAAAEQNKAGVARAISQFRAGQTVDTSGLLPGVVSTLTPLILSPVNAKYLRTDDAIDVPRYAAKLPSGTRVLVTDGTADTNVPPSTIGPLVDALATAGTTGPGLTSLPGLDHDLNPAGTQPNGAPLDPSFLAALNGWAQPYASTP